MIDRRSTVDRLGNRLATDLRSTFVDQIVVDRPGHRTDMQNMVDNRDVADRHVVIVMPWHLDGGVGTLTAAIVL